MNNKPESLSLMEAINNFYNKRQEVSLLLDSFEYDNAIDLENSISEISVNDMTGRAIMKTAILNLYAHYDEQIQVLTENLREVLNYEADDEDEIIDCDDEDCEDPMIIDLRKGKWEIMSVSSVTDSNGVETTIEMRSYKPHNIADKDLC